MQSDTKISGPNAIERLANYDVWIFDLDNTLYPASCNLFSQVEVNMTQFITELLDIGHREAHEIQKQYFFQHGTTMRGLMHHHAIKPDDFLKFVHNIDLSNVPRNLALSSHLQKLPGRKIIFTNGSVDHAVNVTTHLGINHHFDDIFDIVASGFIPKPDPSVYQTLIEKYDIDPSSAVMVEDMAQNLKPAAEIGMSTVWIRTETAWGTDLSDQSYIHHIIDDLTIWLEVVTSHVRSL